MSQLSSRQRKIAYFVAIALLAIPIFLLGMPAGSSTGEQGGKLAELRAFYELGEPNLGDVDPTSATMNLVLLGFRGVAANLLWQDCLHYEQTKNWAKVRSTRDSVILLQPHFTKVLRHYGWDTAWNIAAEWDAVEDRFFWIKDGIKFLQRGTRTNRKAAEMYFDTARTMGQKIGTADEKSYYIKFFREDPDKEKFKGGPDLQINPENKPHFLAARDVYNDANRVEETYGQRQMARLLFRQYPYLSLMQNSVELQELGDFGEVTRAAWNEAFDEWTQKFGQEPYATFVGIVRLEMTDEDVESSAKEQQINANDLRGTVDTYQRMVNYRYWRTRALSESEALTEQAHREIFEGQQAFKEAKLTRARELLESGMTKYAQVIQKYNSLASEDGAIDEILNALLYWRYILQLQQQPIPREYPLRGIWDQNQPKIGELDRRFKLENGLQ